MGLDRLLSAEAVLKRKAVEKLMNEVRQDLVPFVEKAEFPQFMIDKLRALNINGFHCKDFGGTGMTTLEIGALMVAMSRVDMSVAVFYTVHNGLGITCIDRLCNEE